MIKENLRLTEHMKAYEEFLEDTGFKVPDDTDIVGGDTVGGKK